MDDHRPRDDGYLRSMRNLRAFYPSDYDAIKAYVDQLESFVKKSATAAPVVVGEDMVERAANAYEDSAEAEGFDRVSGDLKSTHRRWMRAALTAALAGG